MFLLCVYHGTVQAYRMGLLVYEEFWITSRTPLYHLDLAVPNEILFKRHFDEVFPKYSSDTGVLKRFHPDDKRRVYHHDDTSVGIRGGTSDKFHVYVATATAESDNMGMIPFFDFLKSLDADAPSLSSGGAAARFVNLAERCGYQRWKKRVLRKCSHKHHSHLLVDRVFAYIYPSVLKGLRKAKKELLLKKFWDVFCITEKTRFLMFQDVPDAEHLEFMLRVANRTKFDFWGMRYGVKGFTERVIVDYVKRGHCDLAMLMLDYGFHLGKENCKRVIEENVLSLGKNHLRISPLSFFCIKEFIPNGFMVWFLVRCCANCTYPMELPRFLELYQRLHRSLPLPSVPPNIVRKYLTSNLDYLRYSRRLVEVMTATYKACGVHDPDTDVVAPRTLRHQSRCVVRKLLGDNFQLPTGIDKLDIPVCLKRYLTLEF